VDAFGEEWKVGAGKVDWLVYQKGKVSKEYVSEQSSVCISTILTPHSAAKPSRPSRAYLHVNSQTYIQPLGNHVRQTTFDDAAKSTQDSVLIGPPTLEYAPYPRIPGGRRRHDNRQGTIDQDQEFKDFLESLTNPIVKPAAPEGEGQKGEKVKTTPLIEALREKKANKDKPQTKTPRRGRDEPKEDGGDKSDKKGIGKTGKEASSNPGDKSRRHSKAEKAAKEAVKVLNKEAANKDVSASPSAEKITPAAASPAPERKRGNVNIAKSMLQRDLGIGPAANRRRGTKREVGAASTTDTAAQSADANVGRPKPKETSAPALTDTEKTVPASPKKPSRAERRAVKSTLTEKTNSKISTEDAKGQNKVTNTPAPTILKKPQVTPGPAPPRGPAVSRAPTEPAASRSPAPQSQVAPAKAESSRPQGPATASQTPAPTGRQAFLKHANPSQGITEPLIEEALKAFGTIEKVEIDKRKGFAYVDFADTEGLRKAIAGSPVKIAQGAVQVLEKKEKVVRNRPHPGPHGPPTGPARGRGGFPVRGRGRGGARGGGHTVPSAPAGENAPPVSAPPPAPATADVTT
jgi:regulator of nonsense transcripts 3